MGCPPLIISKAHKCPYEAHISGPVRCTTLYALIGWAYIVRTAILKARVRCTKLYEVGEIVHLRKSESLKFGEKEEEPRRSPHEAWRSGDARGSAGIVANIWRPRCRDVT